MRSVVAVHLTKMRDEMNPYRVNNNPCLPVLLTINLQPASKDAPMVTQTHDSLSIYLSSADFKQLALAISDGVSDHARAVELLNVDNVLQDSKPV